MRTRALARPSPPKSKIERSYNASECARKVKDSGIVRDRILLLPVRGPSATLARLLCRWTQAGRGAEN